MKGISLPVNMIVVIVVGLIVLIAIIALVIYFQPKEDWEALYRIACINLIKDCSQSWYDIEVRMGDRFYPLKEICFNLGVNDEETCKKNCGCP